ncbi:hypothetical protein CDO73_03805 [Saccharibacillus sp. O23]|nr:hypothetical protein CDO73_03805 [Saccharibacillus sp. O23]
MFDNRVEPVGFERPAYPFTPEDLTVERQEIGKDTLFVVRGGEAHIGAVSTAYFEDGAIVVETTSLPGHKEALLSEPAARRAAESLRRTVTVVMGIHYDGITAEQIAEVSAIASKRLEEALRASSAN